ncbi:hypothetical protein Goshw_015206, partial [Gossypium schwendimanii]|nr:hypothetical protein [Gossypium schwendimanii]
ATKKGHFFIEILAEEAQKENKPSNTFKAVSINRWQIICTIGVESGFRWDDNMKMITCDRAAYDAAVMAHKKY